MLRAPLFVIALDPKPHAASGKIASKGFLRFEWLEKGICVPLFTTQNTAREFLRVNPPPVNIGGQYIREPQELADILEVCRTDSDAKWAVIDPHQLPPDGCQCVPIQDAIDDLLKQDRDSNQ